MVKIFSITKNYITFKVESSRGGTHDVIYDRRNMQWSCTCEDYWYRKRQCKHCKEAIRFLNEISFELNNSNIAYVGETITPIETIKEVVE